MYLQSIRGSKHIPLDFEDKNVSILFGIDSGPESNRDVPTV